MSAAEFEVDLDVDLARRFADMSGDWNPLHTDADYAAKTEFGRPVLHGAYVAALASRLAGMHLPGRGALLHGMRLRFVAPIRPPLRVVVGGRVVSASRGAGAVEFVVSEKHSGARLAEGCYDFGHHRMSTTEGSAGQPSRSIDAAIKTILVTGATGGLGSAVMAALGPNGCAVARGELASRCLLDWDGPIRGIVHCAWPAPDDEKFSAMRDAKSAIDFHVAAPLGEIQVLGALLAKWGAPGASLVLVGSSAALPGRHAWRSPLYSVAKGMVPALAQILAKELAPAGKRCMAVLFDVMDGGMNRGMSDVSRVAAADRLPSGRLPTTSDAAREIVWLLDNSGLLVSGATLTLTGAALP